MATQPQPKQPVVVVQNVEESDRHRCTCCCCRCCHIKVACIVIMVLELLNILRNFYDAYKMLGYGGISQLIKAHAGLTFATGILLLAAIICCFVAISRSKPKLVLPHIIVQVLQVLILMISAILAICLLAIGEETNEAFNKQLGFGQIPNIGNTAGVALNVYILIEAVCTAAFQIWSIFKFRQLKRYVEEKESFIVGGVHNVQPVPGKNA